MSSLFSKVEYVPLQFVKEHPVEGHYRLFVKDDYILVLGVFEHIYMFDRKDGHFIKEVSRMGYGPEEYRKLMHGAPFYPQKDVVFVDQFKKWKGFDVRTGKVVIEVDRPSTYYAEMNENQAPINNLFWFDLKNDQFLGYPNNVTGDYPDMLVLFDRKGEIKKTKKSFRTPAGKEAGLTDDINGLTPFLPMYYNGRQLVGSIDPDVLLEKDTKHQLKQVSPKGKSLIESLQFDDNPVVVITTLKN